MENQTNYTVAVVGATGAVGQQMISLLEERNFPVGKLKLLASGRSAGKTVRFRGEDVTIEEAKPESFAGVDYALFSAGGSVSKELAPHAVEHGAVVIDNTSAYRMDPQVPLVVPEVNMDAARQHKGIIANPNCSTIQMVCALKPLYDRYGIDRIIVSTYQAVSGAGASAIDELITQTRDVLDGKEPKANIMPVGKLPVHYPIAFNAIPQIDVFTENGFTFEEMKMVNETKKILGDEEVKVAATCVRLPIVKGHSESVYIELKDEYDLDEVFSLLGSAPGVVLVDSPSEQRYPLALDCAGKLEVFVGRIRRDLTHPRGLHMWVVSDNLLKGAAWNTVQIAEELIKDRQ
ncbi:aspartate-semialdehyde dehydrogenase [Brevibacillus humidisoli]|uniref:aspartate-semialdehyde dehydrogenase n=1 Tax=Brevibacillus humidisoli TaxID=2895522 RepID=UPI001E3B7FAF|nr:aspartate-semialdehyde dehydrogenase [Brevibacillus humidisoli]UFJ42183.1 aspartate-semialdehyde dehydrogenase [Brevibacillus humidisoli]